MLYSVCLSGLHTASILYLLSGLRMLRYICSVFSTFVVFCLCLYGNYSQIFYSSLNISLVEFVFQIFYLPKFFALSFSDFLHQIQHCSNYTSVFLVDAKGRSYEVYIVASLIILWIYEIKICSKKKVLRVIKLYLVKIWM